MKVFGNRMEDQVQFEPKSALPQSHGSSRSSHSMPRISEDKTVFILKMDLPGTLRQTNVATEGRPHF